MFLGVPAISFVLHAAHGPSARYSGALETIDAHVASLAHRRTDAAMARINRGELPEFREYDVFYGLTGIGAHLLRRDPGGSGLERILSYLVALTRPLRANGHHLPGWWVAHDPHFRTSDRYPGGHGNFGVAHGVSGPLLLLSHAMRRGLTVDGQRDAIVAICNWLDAWQQDAETGPWWPELVTMADLRRGRPSQSGVARPSWCYGTPGIARAGQVAAIATHDPCRQQLSEEALTKCLTDPAQLSRITEAGLCHGWAGIYQTAWRAAHDATTSALHACLPRLADTLVRCSRPDAGTAPGFLDGGAGIALALNTAARDTAPTSGWDACLLID